MRPISPIPMRPRQPIPAEIITDLLHVIRTQFYSDAPTKQFHQDKNFLLRRVILWPATWFTKRGVTLPADRYKAILLGIFNTIKVHGSTQAVKYWPGYLCHCVQQHFAHHGDEIYNEAKSMRTLAENLLLSARANVVQKAPDPIAELARAAQLVQITRRKKSAPKSPQLSLL